MTPSEEMEFRNRPPDEGVYMDETRRVKVERA